MKKAERNKLLQRYTELINRIKDLTTIQENTVSLFDEDLRGTIDSILTESRTELDNIVILKNTKYEFLFNFIGGGWNSERAFYEEEAIEQALFKYGHPITQTSLRVDTKSFRVSTPSDYRSLMSTFN